MDARDKAEVLAMIREAIAEMVPPMIAEQTPPILKWEHIPTRGPDDLIVRIESIPEVIDVSLPTGADE
jgi:hypothetical protein